MRFTQCPLAQPTALCDVEPSRQGTSAQRNPLLFLFVASAAMYTNTQTRNNAPQHNKRCLITVSYQTDVYTDSVCMFTSFVVVFFTIIFAFGGLLRWRHGQNWFQTDYGATETRDVAKRSYPTVETRPPTCTCEWNGLQYLPGTPAVEMRQTSLNQIRLSSFMFDHNSCVHIVKSVIRWQWYEWDWKWSSKQWYHLCTKSSNGFFIPRKSRGAKSPRRVQRSERLK